MSFLNIQLGGSIFEHQDSRSKSFTAKFDIEAARRTDTPFGAQERDAIEWAKAHEKMYDEAIAYIASCRLETYRKDVLAIEFARNRDADEERKRAAQYGPTVIDELALRNATEIPRDRGNRTDHTVVQPIVGTRVVTIGTDSEKKGGDA